jgi:hypothetical protein
LGAEGFSIFVSTVSREGLAVAMAGGTEMLMKMNWLKVSHTHQTVPEKCMEYSS